METETNPSRHHTDTTLPTGRGKLRIFLGYSEQVGKTYAMLEAALQQLSEGYDVVNGVCESHGQPDLQAMIDQLPALPSTQEEEKARRELAVDELIARHPQIVIVDELAQTNPSGARHPKRFQDVEELLAAGIEVYTTLNIYNLESLKDIVAQIAGLSAEETIPDAMIEKSDHVEVVDRVPEELLTRLNHQPFANISSPTGRIKDVEPQAALTALRELALRWVAERVDVQMQRMMQAGDIPGPWPAAEHILVCIEPDSLAERLIRTTSRLAEALKAPWTALYVEIPGHFYRSTTSRAQIDRILQLAEALGGRTLIKSGQRISDTVLEYARQHNITKIVVGRSIKSFWRDLFHQSLPDQLTRHSTGLDLYVVSQPAAAQARPAILSLNPRHNLKIYIWGFVLVTLASLLGSLIHRVISPTNLVMIYLLAVMIAAYFLGRGVAVLVSILGVLVFDFFFVPPYYTLVVAQTEYLLTFAGLFGVGYVISDLTARMKDQAEAATRREAETAALYNLSRALAIVEGLEDIIATFMRQMQETFNREGVVLLPDHSVNGNLQVYIENPRVKLDEAEMKVAEWVYQHRQPAGRGTQTLPEAQARYTPLITPQGVVGVLAVKPQDPQSWLTPEERQILDTFASQVALAIERALLAKEAQQAELLRNTEKLHHALLNSISHDLRTPLASITGSLSSLMADASRLDAETRAGLLETAREEADRLNNLVGNLLNMSRIEAGALHLVIEPQDMQDVIGSALERLEKALKGWPVQVTIPADLPLVPLDFVLIVQVLANLLDNAIKYSPQHGLIEIKVLQLENDTEVQVLDEGVGIPAADLERVFDKFYRVQGGSRTGGTGLGLSICKGIVDAHHGTIQAERRSGGGTLIRLRLPLKPPPGGEPGKPERQP